MNKSMSWVKALAMILLALAVAACGGDQAAENTGNRPSPKPAAQKPALIGDAVAGQTEYVQYCSACHGPDAKGLKGLGKDLTASDFIRNLSDEEFLHYVQVGRAADDPLNTTGIPMPPKGGNPALSDQQIMNIIAHIRTFYQ